MVESFGFNRRQFGGLVAGLTASLGAGSAWAQNTRPFKLGALNSITGAGGVYGPGMLEAIKLAVKEVNDAGGAAGRKFEIFAEDDQTRADAAVLAAKKLVEITKVEAIVGIWPSAVQLAVMPITNAAGIITMNTSGAPEIDENDKLDLVWQFYGSNVIFGRAFAETVRKLGYKRPGVMAFNNATMLAQARYFQKTWEEKGDKVVDFIPYEPNQTSYRTELDRLLSKKPDIISASSYLPDLTIILKEWYQSGIPCKFIAPGWSANETLARTLGADVVDGILSVSNVPATQNPAFKHFSSAFKAATGREPETFAAASYDMVICLALALQAAGAEATPAQIASKIRTVAEQPGKKVSSFAEGRELLLKGEKIDFDGASAPLTFTPEGRSTPDFGIYEFQKDKLVLKEVIRLT
ncbi:MAG: ABC transporter substrate-binding protein [Rhizobiales bacterium]|nr:ABC transporter substrate-binding protein [Hyphomicrobiales bacterium]